MKKNIIIIVFFYLLFPCCQKDLIKEEEIIFNSEIRFIISDHLLPGRSVSNIVFIDEKNLFCSVGTQLLYLEGGIVKDSFTATSDVLSLAYRQQDNSLFFGTYSSGLGRLYNGEIYYSTAENANLPYNRIRELVSDESGNMWFSSSAHQVGGLIKYDGVGFDKFFPENSPLPYNLIFKVKFRSGKIVVVAQNPGGGTKTFQIQGNKWEELFESGGCSIKDIDVDSKGKIYYIDDSRDYCGGGLWSDEVVFVFDKNDKQILREYEYSMDLVYLPYVLKIDKRDYVWVGKYSSGDKRLSVFDGKN